MPAANPLPHRVTRETAWTYEALTRQLNATARAAALSTPYDRTPVAPWLRGSVPRDPVPGPLRELLSRHLGRPADPADIGTGHAAPTTGDPARPATPPAGTPGPRPRRPEHVPPPPREPHGDTRPQQDPPGARAVGARLVGARAASAPAGGALPPGA
ncbi:hypothetical protein ABZZ17_24560 [Streptomyces sp. NPDC006512]|uniref:hypothetical protein n=1 Tax=Streptomyces sp. NPDC006512 TaxID=3154307 RepID=UPI0033A9640D